MRKRSARPDSEGNGDCSPCEPRFDIEKLRGETMPIVKNRGPGAIPVKWVRLPTGIISFSKPASRLNENYCPNKD